MQIQELQILWERYTAGQASVEEKAMLFTALQDNADSSILERISESDLRFPNGEIKLNEGTTAQIKAALLQTIQPVHRINFLRKQFKWVAAASILFIAAATWFYFNQGSSESVQPLVSKYKNDVAPGKKGAKLKLSDGRIIELDSAKNGLIAMEGKMQVYKVNNEIVYKEPVDVNGKTIHLKETEMLYNELIADKKQRSAATLPDGSIAWVNAESSLRYPVLFIGKERKVNLTGEGAFKVKHNASNPFLVEVRGQIFEDQGTEFDINAYSDEPVIKTTVLEGSVSSGKTIIKAGQQARVDKNGTVKVLDNVNTDDVFAWRDGEFTFGDSGIEEIMKAAKKWYDVDVVYEDKIDQHFTILGLTRNTPISTLLRTLEKSGGVHFEIDGKKIIVKK